MEPPKVNLEIVSAMTEIAVKWNHYFANMQRCVRAAIISPGTGLSMLLENPEEGIDQLSLISYLWDTSKLLTDVFFQQSVARKFFIIPLMDKAIKLVLDTTDQRLYEKKLV